MEQKATFENFCEEPESPKFLTKLENDVKDWINKIQKVRCSLRSLACRLWSLRRDILDQLHNIQNMKVKPEIPH